MGNCCLLPREDHLSVDVKHRYRRYDNPKHATVDDVPQDVSGAPTGWKGYHGAISNEQAENRLRIKGASNGMFLVYDEPPDVKASRRHRSRAMHQGQYLLAVYYNRKVHRIRILRRSDGKYVLGQDVPGARAHDSVHKLIKHHQRPCGKAINLEGGGHVTLEGYVYLTASE